LRSASSWYLDVFWEIFLLLIAYLFISYYHWLVLIHYYLVLRFFKSIYEFWYIWWFILNFILFYRLQVFIVDNYSRARCIYWMSWKTHRNCTLFNIILINNDSLCILTMSKSLILHNKLIIYSCPLLRVLNITLSNYHLSIILQINCWPLEVTL
jgi:hypothetical protein